MGRKLVAGVDSSTQSVKVVIRDADTGELVRQGKAAHPDGTEVNPAEWMSALKKAFEVAGGLSDVAAISIGAQQHGFIALDEKGNVIIKKIMKSQEKGDLYSFRKFHRLVIIEKEIHEVISVTGKENGKLIVYNYCGEKIRELNVKSEELLEKYKF